MLGGMGRLSKREGLLELVDDNAQASAIYILEGPGIGGQQIRVVRKLVPKFDRPIHEFQRVRPRLQRLGQRLTKPLHRPSARPEPHQSPAALSSQLRQETGVQQR